MKFMSENVNSWQEFIEKKDEFDKPWVYRGQSDDWELKTTLERSRDFFEINWSDLPNIEIQMIRDFRRRYPNLEDKLLHKDMLYCLALMQHHGAPTRLLDFSYSPLIAAFFALENSGKNPVLWCLNIEWIESCAITAVGEDLIRSRSKDEERNDVSFKDMYIKIPLKKFIYLENPIRLNQRLTVQQGVFLCPGDITTKTEDNIKAMKGYNHKKNLLKLQFNFAIEERKNALYELHQMNINRASLFPGLDGFAQSIKQRIPLYSRLSSYGSGTGGLLTR